MASTVHVENISSQTSEQEVREFFSFCGKIQSLSVTPTSDSAQSASVTFEKEAAAKTALLLDKTQLGPNQVEVKGAASLSDLGATSADEQGDTAGKEGVEQEDKPRSRILAEYLAQGYGISDKAIEKALQLDQQHGIWAKFTNTLNSVDQKLQASSRAAAVDTKLGVSDKATAGWHGLSSYFDKALGTPTGQKLRAFYVSSNQQVLDVHNEARHLANLKSGKFTPEKVEGSDKTKCGCAGGMQQCGCTPGYCACDSCGKNISASGGAAASTSEESGEKSAEAEKPAA